MEQQQQSGVTEVKAKLTECVTLIIEYWPAVQLAFQHGWISKNHRKFKDSDEAGDMAKGKKFNETEADVKKRFITELTDFIYDYDVDQFAIEDFLTEFVEDNFYMELEDESQRHIARLLDSLNKSLSDGDDKVYEEIKEMARKFGKKFEPKKAADSSDDEGDDGDYDDDQGSADEEEKEAEEAPPLVDDDGFTTVTAKKGKKK